MTTTTYYAAKDLKIDGTGTDVKAGDVLFTIETDHDPAKMLRAIENGCATTEKPKPAANPVAGPVPPVAPAVAPK